MNTLIHTRTQADLALLPANVVGFGLVRVLRGMAKVFPGCVCMRTHVCVCVCVFVCVDRLDSHAHALGGVPRVCVWVGVYACVCV